MAGKTFHASVITPERAVLEAEASSVVFPAHDGEVGVLPGRAPLLHEMGIGVLRLETAEGDHTFFVDGGFAQMTGDKLTLLTEQAKRPEEIDRAAAEKALSSARELPLASPERARAIRRAEVQIRLKN